MCSTALNRFKFDLQRLMSLCPTSHIYASKIYLTMINSWWLQIDCILHDIGEESWSAPERAIEFPVFPDFQTKYLHLQAADSSSINQEFSTITMAKSARDHPRQHLDSDGSIPSTDTMSHATGLLIRRVLCPQIHGSLTEGQTPLDQLLPPLTSSNAVDLQLYAIIAIVMRDSVSSWYGKISPDQSFVQETIQIIAHCTRELEERLRRVDMNLLLLHEIPHIIDLHIEG